MTNNNSIPENLSSFPTRYISQIAEKESWRKEINRPIYHIHKWWAQRLGSVFRGILLYLMCDDRNDVWKEFYTTHDFNQYTVLDPFMGSGTTIGEALKLGANAIGCDINPVSTFMVKQEFTRVSLIALYDAFEQVKAAVAETIHQYYKTINPQTGHEIPVLYYFWVKVVTTPSGEDIPLFSSYIFAKNAYPSKKPLAQIVCPKCWYVFEGKYNDTEAECPCCHHNFNPQHGPANSTTVIDSLGKKHKIKELIPSTGLLKEKMYAVLALDEDGTKKYFPITKYDLDLYQKAKEELENHKLFVPQYAVRPGHNTDQARNYNYLFWKDFFNARQQLCLGMLLESILLIQDQKIREQLICLFSSTLEYNNMFCSFKGEGTGAVRPIFSNHILKPERTPLENSVWGYNCSSGCFSTLFKTKLLKAKEYLDKPFELKIDEKSNACEKIVASDSLHPTICDSWDELAGKKHATLLLNGDSACLPVPDATVDFVVTDPPYFDFIHYSELSDFFYAWLSPILKEHYPFFSSDTSGRDNEVQQTDANKFSEFLKNVFSECRRVLKADGKLVFSFHHSRADGWIAIANSIQKSGFFVDECFPVYAELMASTPKASAKEPISLDAIIVCSKQKREASAHSVISTAVKVACDMIDSGRKLSIADIFVISSSQCLRLLVSDSYTEDQKTDLLNETFSTTLRQIREIQTCDVN